MNGSAMNQLAKLTAVIDSYIQQRQAANDPLTGQEEMDFDWIAKKLQRASQLQQQGKRIRFQLLYGRLLGAATAFIEKYVPSEPQQ